MSTPTLSTSINSNGPRVVIVFKQFKLNPNTDDDTQNNDHLANSTDLSIKSPRSAYIPPTQHPHPHIQAHHMCDVE